MKVIKRSYNPLMFSMLLMVYKFKVVNLNLLNPLMVFKV